MLRSLYLKLWNSPTVTTWLSFFVKSVPFIIVIPMMLHSLDAALVNVWNLFISIITIQNLIDIGFGSTFVRGFAYADSGVGDFSDNSKRDNWQTLDLTKKEIEIKLYGTMNGVYKVILVIQLIVAATIGTYLLNTPINQTNSVQECWIAWAFIIFSSCFALYSRKYINLLLGYNFVALQKRVDAMINSFFLLVAITVFYFTNSIMYFIIVSQTYHFFNLLILRKLVKREINEYSGKYAFSKQVFFQIWPSAWKSFLGVLFSSGLAQITNLFYAQYATAINSAVYGLYLRVISGISSFSQAPFYSKIPQLISLRAKNDSETLYQKAKVYMLRAYLVFVFGIYFFEFFGIPIFNYFGKEIVLNNNKLFYLLTFSFLIERFGAMHIQLVSTSNKIIWHLANGFNGVFIIGFIIIFKETLGVLVFPLSMLIGNLLIYAPISAYHSYKLSKQKLLIFEKQSFLLPLLLLLGLLMYKFV